MDGVPGPRGADPGARVGVGRGRRGGAPPGRVGAGTSSGPAVTHPGLHLEMRVELVGIPLRVRVHVLLGVRVVQAAVVAVGVLVHEELDVRLLGLQPHRGARRAAAAPAGEARLPPPGRPFPPRRPRPAPRAAPPCAAGGPRRRVSPSPPSLPPTPRRERGESPRPGPAGPARRRGVSRGRGRALAPRVRPEARARRGTLEPGCAGPGGLSRGEGLTGGSWRRRAGNGIPSLASPLVSTGHGVSFGPSGNLAAS